MTSEADTLFSQGKFYEKGYWFYTKNSSLSKAIDCFYKAGNLYYEQSFFSLASECFRSVIYLESQLGYPQNPSSYDKLIKALLASGCKKEAVREIESIITLYIKNGNFLKAGERIELLATLDPENEIQHKKRAVELYTNHNLMTSSTILNENIADTLALSDKDSDLTEAIQLYEKIADYQLTNRLLMFNVKIPCFKAGLCYLKKGIMSPWLSEYEQKYKMFCDTNEHSFLKSMISNPSSFSTLLENYQILNSYSEFNTKMFDSIKVKFSSQ